ncbi:hypothetical protein L1887_35665 [Cichorium endivia]|nr:hypothetical protein L1887_35665 [Cichorium endivia]
MAEKEEKKDERKKGEKEETKDYRKKEKLYDKKRKPDEKKPDDKFFYGYPSDNQEFGRDTNRLDYFRVTAFDVFEDNHLNTRTANYGGGGPSRPEQEGGSATVRAGGSERTQEVPERIISNRLEQERVDDGSGGGRWRHRIVPGPRMEFEIGSSIGRASGGNYNWPRQSPVNEALVERLKHEGVIVPRAVVVAGAVMMMVMVILMVIMMVTVVLVLVMSKMQVSQ